MISNQTKNTILNYLNPFSLGRSFAYKCDSGFCTPEYGRAIFGTSEDVARICSIDHPFCKAYQYSASNGYGHLCPSVSMGGTLDDYKNCKKLSGKTEYPFCMLTLFGKLLIVITN